VFHKPHWARPQNVRGNAPGLLLDITYRRTNRMKQFEEKIETLFNYIHEYGVQNVSFDFKQNPENFTEDQRKEFTRFVHKGFRLGQELILKELIDIETQLKVKNDELKEHKRNKAKDLQSKINREIAELKYQDLVLRNFADFIVWQVCRNQYYIVRRFSSGVRNRPSLLNSNIETVIATVKHYHDKDEDCFALMADITGLLDIGDILLIKDGQIQHIEVKEGVVNKEILNLIENFTPEEADKKINSAANPKEFLKHFDRTLKQMEKGIKAIDLLKNEEGPDPFRKSNVKIRETNAEMKQYYDVMFEMLETLNTKDWAYQVIENVILIGMYKNSFLPLGEELIQHISKEISQKEYPVFSYHEQLFAPFKQPIFYKPFGKEVLFDIIFGRLKIVLLINFDNLVEFFNINGVEARWLSRKETAAIVDKNKETKPFIFENRAIQVKVGGKEIVLGDTFIIRLIFDNLYPSALIEMYKDTPLDKQE